MDSAVIRQQPPTKSIGMTWLFARFVDKFVIVSREVQSPSYYSSRSLHGNWLVGTQESKKWLVVSVCYKRYAPQVLVKPIYAKHKDQCLLVNLTIVLFCFQ